MRALIIGGTGLISQGVVKHLLARGADVTAFNRGQRGDTLGSKVKTIIGDRNKFDDFAAAFKNQKFDVIIDMICFEPRHAESDVSTFGGRCDHFIFCSSVCSYGVKVPPGVFVDETFPQEPISPYGKNKVLCEQIFLRAGTAGKFKTTIVRPSHTYGEGDSLIDNLEGNPRSWDRIERGLPVICAGDGLGLWVATHRDDVGKLFAYAALNPKTFGQDYNGTCEWHMTWREYIREAAAALGKKAHVLFLPAQWINKHDPGRFGLLREITAWHGAYTSAKARRDVPEFKCEIKFRQGARRAFADVRRRNAWRDSSDDTLYQKMVDEALALGIEPQEA